MGLAGELRRHRFLLFQLARRSFAARHAENLLGWWWSLISTAFQALLFWVIFSRVIGIRIAEPRGVGFAVYLMTGLVPFAALQDALTRSATVFRRHAAIVQRVRFPLGVLVTGDLLGTLAYHALPLTAVGIWCLAAGHLELPGMGGLVLGLVFLAVWTLGLGLALAVVGALLPDVDHVLSLALQAVFYGAPIVYPLSMVGEGALGTVVQANPLTVMVELVRMGLIGAAAPAVAPVVAVAVGGVVLVVAGTALLSRYRWRIPDVV